MLAKDAHMSDLIKSIIIFALLTVVTVGAFGFYLFSNSRMLITKEVSRDSLYRLEHVRDYLEMTTLKRYEELYRDKIVSTVFEKYDGLSFFLNDVSGNLGYRFVELQKDLQNARLSQEGLNNMTAHFLNTGYTVDAKYVYERPANSRDSAFLGTLSSFPLERWTVRDKGDGSRVLTYLRTMPYGASHESATGYLYLDVSLSYLTSLMHAMLSSADERFYIFDTDGSLMLTNANQAEAAALGSLDKLYEADTSITVTEEAGRTTVSAYSPGALSEYGLGFVVTRPLDSFLLDTKKSQHDLMIASIIAVAIGLAISLLMSRRVYLPLKRMVGSIQSLRSSLEKTRLLKLIHGDVEHAGPLPYAEQSLFAVVYCRCESHAELLLPSFSQSTGLALQWESIALSQDELAILVVLEPDTPSELAEKAVREALTTLQIDACGFGTTAPGLAHIAYSFREAKQAARYSFLFGAGAIIGYPEIETRVNATAEMNFERFENSIHALDMDGVSAYLSWFENELTYSDYQVETAEWALMQLSVCVRRMALHYHLSDRIEAFVLTQAPVCRTLKEGLQQVEATCRQIISCLSSDVPHAHAETISVIERYIHEHLHEDISLDRVAELVSFSSSYISKLFIEVIHVPFIEYLNRARLTHAAELLRDSNESVTRIAGQVGYSNVQYFCTKFKAKYEMTPNQYRKTIRAKVQAEAT